MVYLYVRKYAKLISFYFFFYMYIPFSSYYGISPAYIFNYWQPVEKLPRKNKNWITASENKKKFRSEISSTGLKRIEKTIDWFYYLTPKKQINQIHDDRRFSFKLSFLTLTLPCEQLHTDLFIKKNMLNQLMIRLRKNFNCNNYLWKAEKTKSKNIHFHILLDNYVPYSAVNIYWNSILSTNGYIKKYQENQTKFHENGFHFRKEFEKSWPYENQLKAYKKGIAENWRNPTGTTDIHALKKVKNVKAYIKKYLCKKLYEVDICGPNPNYNYSIDFNMSNAEGISDSNSKEKKEETDKTQIEGALWFCSHTLSHINNITLQEYSDLNIEFENYRKNYPSGYKDCDYGTLYFINFENYKSVNMPTLAKEIDIGLISIREEFFRQKEISFSSKNILQ